MTILILDNNSDISAMLKVRVILLSISICLIILLMLKTSSTIKEVTKFIGIFNLKEKNKY